MCYSYITEYYSVMKRRKFCNDMDESKDIVLSKISQTKTIWMISLICGLWKKKKTKLRETEGGTVVTRDGSVKQRWSTVNQRVYTFHCKMTKLWGSKVQHHDCERKKVKSLSRFQLFVTLWTAAYQAPPSMGFSRQEYWGGLPFPSPGDLPDPGIEPRSPASRADAVTSEPPGKPQ